MLRIQQVNTKSVDRDDMAISKQQFGLQNYLQVVYDIYDKYYINLDLLDFIL